MERLLNWLLSRPPRDQVAGLSAWIQAPRTAAPVEIRAAVGLKLALVLAVIGWVMPLSFESNNTPFDHPVASSIGALVGLAVWLAAYTRRAHRVRLSAEGLSIGRMQIPWAAFDSSRRTVLWNGLMLTLPLGVDAKVKVSGGAILNRRELILPVFQRVRPDDLYAAVNAGVAAFRG